MSVISVIIPGYRVEVHLRRCMDKKARIYGSFRNDKLLRLYGLRIHMPEKCYYYATG